MAHNTSQADATGTDETRPKTPSTPPPTTNSHFHVRLEKNITGIPSLFAQLNQEIAWRNDITHKGGSLPRRFALQAEITHGQVPRYSKPMDQAPPVLPYSPIVNTIRTALERKFGLTLNHCILQQYRDGHDHITEHSDKTLDVAPGSYIVNFSAGETRTMTFRSKERLGGGAGERDTRKVLLEDDSVLLLDLDTNRYYRHCVKRDVETQGLEGRISLTFRHVATFYDSKEGNRVYGQGAPKEGEEGMSVDELRHAWGVENSSSDFVWEEVYGRGYKEPLY